MKIFYDVDTQNDFMNKDGALYVPDAELIKPNLKKLTDFARENCTPVVGSVDRHFGTPEYKEREKELQRNGGIFPDHCMAGTFGQKKILETTLVKKYPDESGKLTETAFYIPYRTDNTVDEEQLMLNLSWITSGTAFGLYFEKQSYDVFTNPETEEYLGMLGITEALVYGVATDYCIKAAVLGMQHRGIQCYVVEDAIKGVAEKSTKQALEEMLKAGARFIRTENVLKEEK